MQTPPVHSTPIHLYGNAEQRGVYLLHLQIGRALTMSLGRFQKGKPIAFAAGAYLYVGSALGARGSASLAGRLLRHATRSGDLPPHPLRVLLWQHFGAAGLGPPAMPRPAHKRLFWHIDYLLDAPEVDLVQIFAIRTSARLEAALAAWLAAAPYTFVVVQGIGASDAQGATHLFGLHPNQPWAERLVGYLRSLPAHP